MKSYTCIPSLSFALVFVFTANVARADYPKTEFGIEQCLHAALAEKNGGVVKVELKIEKDIPTYEFDIETPDGKAWDIECDTKTGKISEIEQEVKNAKDPLFKAKLKVNEKAARKVALAEHPGQIVEVEYEIEPDGAASYEFDIKGKDGQEMKVEVDATSGKIVEANGEVYQIGKED
jgi:uncharacterized membrane protein YkoI